MTRRDFLRTSAAAALAGQTLPDTTRLPLNQPDRTELRPATIFSVPEETRSGVFTATIDGRPAAVTHAARGYHCLGFDLSVSRYEMSAGPGSNANLWAWMIVQSGNLEQSTDGSEPSVAGIHGTANAFRTSDMTGRWSGWVASLQDFDVQPGETILVGCGICTESDCLFTVGNARCEAHATVRKISVRFHN